MQKGDVPLQVLLALLEDPLLEVDEIKGVRVLDLLGLQPLDKEGEVISNLLPIEDPIDHVTAEQPHLDLVASVRVDLAVLVDRFEDVRGRRSVRKLQVIEGFLVNR